MMKSHSTPRWYIRRSVFVVGVHLLAFTLAYWLAFALKFDFALKPEQKFFFLFTLPCVLVVKSIIFSVMGQYRLSWRSVTFTDLASLLKAATVALVVIVGLFYFMESSQRTVGRLIPWLDWMLTVVILGGLRAFYRLTREEFRFSSSRHGATKALIVGANQSGHTLARHLYTEERPKYLVLGFLDEDVSKHGSMIGGLPVLGTPERAPQIAVRMDAKEVLVISGALTGKQLRQLMENCAQVDVALKVIPAMEDLLAGDYSFQIRNVDIDDLLRREPVQLSGEAIGTLLADRTILVTGAGGSIGSEICRQVLRFHPRWLVLVERAENNLFLIDQELQATGKATRNSSLASPTSPTASEWIDQILAAHQPAMVFHAAGAQARKPMMEENPGESDQEQRAGHEATGRVGRSAWRVQEFVMISTDKAVNPKKTSVMGVS